MSKDIKPTKTGAVSNESEPTEKGALSNEYQTDPTVVQPLVFHHVASSIFLGFTSCL